MKVEGLDNILRNLAKLDPQDWKKEAMKEMRDSHKGARAEMRSNVPTNTGKLRSSIRTQAWSKRQKGGEIGVFVRTGPKLKGKGRKWYAHFPEVGTTHSKAYHYVKKAKDGNEAALRQKMTDIIENVVKKANGND